MENRTFSYTVDQVTFKGLVYPHPNSTAERPTMLLYHAFEGMNDVMADNARRCVEMGMNAVTLDMYGDGAIMETLDACLENCMGLINDRATLHKRLLASINAAKEQIGPTQAPFFAMGFCFGGLCVLDIARLGADIKGVISAHGILAPPPNVTPQHINTKVLACHGYDDPQVPPEQITAFMQEMNDAKADWTFVTFGHTKHAFTDPHADKIGGPEMGREFNAQSTERLWHLIQQVVLDNI